MKGKVTLRSVAAMKPRGTIATFLWDTDVHGFGVRMTPRGFVSYVFQCEQGGDGHGA
jgi:hypothetical protein